MSGTFPTSPAFQSLNIKSIQPTLISRTISGRRQARQIGGQLWKMTATFPPMTRAQFAPIYAFIVAQRGRYESFSLVPPVVGNPQGSAAGTPLVNGASQTGRSLETDGWSQNTAIFKAGDYLKLAGNDKVYMVTADATTAVSSSALTLTIEPALVASPANDEVIIYESIPFTVALTSGVQEFATGATGVYEFEIELEEVL
tara:strand:- start:245 stop:844 length:600 start_codon:yes stop_codon:yes gene_type:complete